MDENVKWHDLSVSQEEKEKLLGQKGRLIWMTGLSGSGKSTIANALSRELYSKGKLCNVLDGDNIRHGLNSDLGFSSKERVENIRRLKEVSKLFTDCGVIVITAFISPFKKDRDSVRKLLNERFIEVFVDCPLEVCEQRDPKKLYEKVKKGEIKNFTGYDSPYEKPENPEIIINTSKESIEECVKKIMRLIYD